MSKKKKSAKKAVVDALKKTPLKPLWWKVKLMPPVYQIRHLLIDIHQDKLLFEWYPEIYSRHSSEPVDERKVILIENAMSGLSNSLQLIYQDLKAAGGFRIHIHHIGNNLIHTHDRDINDAGLVNDLGTARYVFLSEANAADAAHLKSSEEALQSFCSGRT